MPDVTKFLQQCDQYAPPIRMTFKGKRSHQTSCGGCLTIIFFTIISAFFVKSGITLITTGDDEFSQR